MSEHLCDFGMTDYSPPGFKPGEYFDEERTRNSRMSDARVVPLTPPLLSRLCRGKAHY